MTSEQEDIISTVIFGFGLIATMLTSVIMTGEPFAAFISLYLYVPFGAIVEGWWIEKRISEIVDNTDEWEEVKAEDANDEQRQTLRINTTKS